MTTVTEVKRRRFLPYFIFGVVMFYVGHLVTKLYSYAPNQSTSFIWEKIAFVIDKLFAGYVIDFKITQTSFSAGMLFFAFTLLFYLRVQRVGYYRPGEEHGSAKFLSLEDMRSFADEVEDYNIILSKNGRLGLYNERLPYDKQMNKNILVLGGSGDGKTYTFLKPNAMQLNGSKIYTDTKGVLVHELGHFFEVMGYRCIVVDLITFKNTNQFNVFEYIKQETDIDRVAETLVKSMRKSNKQDEEFWVISEQLFLRTLIAYLYFDSRLSGYIANVPQISDLARHIKRTDPEVPSPVEMMLEELEKTLPGNYAYKQWGLLKNYVGETWQSVVAVLSGRFSVFDHDDIRELLERDNLDIERWNLEKTAVFINIPEVNDAYQFISALLFSTIFDVMMKTSDKVITGQLQTKKGLLHTEIYADEVANIGIIPNLEKIMSVIRSREISVKIILQSLSQLIDLYGKEKSNTIFNNCATTVYLGTNDIDTAKMLSERAGYQTIQDNNQSETRSQHGSTSTQHSKLKREVLSVHEIMTIGIDETLVYLSRQNVFRDTKASVNDHKYAKYLANKPSDKTWYRYKRYMSDIDEFLSHVKPSNLIEVTEEEIEAFAS